MSKPKPPQRVTRCTTHHAACDCREWQNERMRESIATINKKIIAALLWNSSKKDIRVDRVFLEEIADSCREALEPISKND